MAEQLTRVAAMAVLSQGGAIERWEYDLKPEGKKDALIRVLACGICATDHHMCENDWGLSRYPLVPGHEVIGEVVSVGAEVTDLPLGTVVGLGCIAQTCDRCAHCVDKQLDNFCEAGARMTYFNDVTDETGTHPHRGGFSSYVRTPASKLLRVPAGMAPELAAPLMCAGITTYAPLREWLGPACDARGKTVGVVGVGGLGHLALQFARSMGADEVVAFSRTSDKEALSRQLGASRFVVTDSDEQMQAAASSVDFLLVTISGGSFDVARYLPLMRAYGVVHLVGVPNDKLSFSVMGPFLMRRLTISSSLVGSTRQTQEMLAFCAEHGVKPMIEKFPHSRANDAMHKVADGSIRFRAVLINDLL